METKSINYTPRKLDSFVKSFAKQAGRSFNKEFMLQNAVIVIRDAHDLIPTDKSLCFNLGAAFALAINTLVGGDFGECKKYSNETFPFEYQDEYYSQDIATRLKDAYELLLCSHEAVSFTTNNNSYSFRFLMQNNGIYKELSLDVSMRQADVFNELMYDIFTFGFILEFICNNLPGNVLMGKIVITIDEMYAQEASVNIYKNFDVTRWYQKAFDSAVTDERGQERGMSKISFKDAVEIKDFLHNDDVDYKRLFHLSRYWLDWLNVCLMMLSENIPEGARDTLVTKFYTRILDYTLRHVLRLSLEKKNIVDVRTIKAHERPGKRIKKGL